MLLKVLQWNILDPSYPMEKFKPDCPANLLTWSTRKIKIEDIITREQPDIICLCEVDEEQKIKINSRIYDVHYMRKKDNPQGLLVAVKRQTAKITKVLKEYFTPPAGQQINQNYLYLEVETKDKFKFALATSHFKAGRDSGEQRLSQAKQMAALLTPKKMPQLVLGDFNAEVSEPSIQHLITSLDLKSVNPELFTAFKLVEGQGITTKKIDYVLHSFEFKLISSLNFQKQYSPKNDTCIFKKYPSDHVATVAVFETVWLQSPNIQSGAQVSLKRQNNVRENFSVKKLKVS